MGGPGIKQCMWYTGVIMGLVSRTDGPVNEYEDSVAQSGCDRISLTGMC